MTVIGCSQNFSMQSGTECLSFAAAFFWSAYIAISDTTPTTSVRGGRFRIPRMDLGHLNRTSLSEMLSVIYRRLLMVSEQSRCPIDHRTKQIRFLNKCGVGH